VGPTEIETGAAPLPLTHCIRGSRRGFCIIDDYHLIDACHRAGTDYRQRNSIFAEVIDIDESGLLAQISGEVNSRLRQKSGNGRPSSKAKPANAWHHSWDRPDAHSS